MRKLDIIDRKILLELDTNARASFSSVGKRLRISKNNVQYRVKRLIEDGVIRKFVTQISLAKLGLFLGKIFIQLSGLNNKIEAEMYAYLSQDNRISWIAKCEGRWDLMLGIYAGDISQFDKVKSDFFKVYGAYVSSYDVIFVTEGRTSPRTYLLNQASTTPKIIDKFVGKEKIVLNETEKKVLKSIANDARFSYIEVSRKLGLNPKTVQKKIKELESNGIIQGYVTFLAPIAIGYNFFKICIYLKDYHKQLHPFINYCLELPNVIHVIESLGPWEIELEVETETLQDFYGITHNIRNNFSTIIKKIEHVIISEEKKLDFLPEWY